MEQQPPPNRQQDDGGDDDDQNQQAALMEELQENMRGDMAAAISHAEAKRRATDLPCFYGDPKQDKLTCTEFFARVRDAAIVARWTQEETAMQFALTLRGDASRFYRNKKNKRPAAWVTNLDNLEPVFLERFEPGATGPQIVRTTRTLKQTADETVDQFYDKIEAATDIWARRIQTPAACRATPAIIQACKLQSEATMDVMIMAFFVAGLRAEYRDKVTEANPQTPVRALAIARNLELNKLGTKETSTTAAAVRQTEEAEGSGEEEEETEGANAVKKKGKKKGKAHAVKSGSSGGSSRKGGGSRSTYTCWYCKKPGHRQDACHTRRRHNAPMVDRYGQPYRVGEVGQQPAGSGHTSAIQAQGMAVQQAQFPLNW